MTPAEEAGFITLWQAGVDMADIAQRLGIPLGTVKSRAYRLRQRGLIQARPRGGAYPRQHALARQTTTAVSPDTPPDTPVSPDTPRVQVLPPEPASMTPVLQEILLELRHLT